jgi:acyl-CoA thioester hydrolase
VTDEYRHRTPVQVRFRDVDAFRHVNNAVFFSYIEQARVRYLLDVLAIEADFATLPLILARVEIDFRSPVLFGDEVTIGSRVDRIGETSFSMSHRVTIGHDDRLAADADSVLVVYDYSVERPMRVPDAWRERFVAHEGRGLEAGASRPTAAAG